VREAVFGLVVLGFKNIFLANSHSSGSRPMVEQRVTIASAQHTWPCRNAARLQHQMHEREAILWGETARSILFSLMETRTPQRSAVAPQDAGDES
jgi:hypothetical protein